MNAPARARAYLSKMPRAVAGQRGHVALFAAACRLVEFGLVQAEAWALLCEWNQTHCDPIWSEPELRHKLSDAFKCTSPKPHFTTPANAYPLPRRACQPAPSPKRPVLPLLRPGTPAELAQLSGLRNLSRKGIGLASELGLLRFGEFKGRPAWFILDASGRVAQVRRLDGLPRGNGVKAWTLPGSQGAWPVGIGEAANCPAVAVVEGGPDLLAMCGLLLNLGRSLDCAPVGLLGSSMRIHPDALPLFAGKRVRIFPHADEAGETGATNWAEQLIQAGADVDVFDIPGLHRADGVPINDLCDLVAIDADEYEAHASLRSLFP